MAQYDEAITTVVSNLTGEGSGLSSTVKAAVESLLTSTSGTRVNIQDYDGSSTVGAQVVRVTKDVALTRDPGTSVKAVIMDADAAPVDIAFVAPAGQERLVVATSGADNLVFTGAGNVTVETGGGSDTVETGAGNDNIVMTGEGEIRQVYTTTGGHNKVTIEGTGEREVNTADGNDAVVLGSASEALAVTVNAGDGFDKVYLAQDRAAHSFTRGADGTVVMNSSPTTMKDVEVVKFDGDSISVIAETHDKSVMAKLYQVVFGRDGEIDNPDDEGGGVEFWLDFVEDSESLEHAVMSFIKSDEFAVKYTGMTNAEIVSDMVGNLYGENMNADVLAHYQNMVAVDLEANTDNNAQALARVAWGLAESQDAVEILGIDGSSYVIDLFTPTE